VRVKIVYQTFRFLGGVDIGDWLTGRMNIIGGCLYLDSIRSKSGLLSSLFFGFLLKVLYARYSSVKISVVPDIPKPRLNHF
jgi:hypothetical protein